MNVPEPIGEAALAFFQKLLGPVGEAGEFLADKIRFYRWQSALKTLKRAREIAQKNNLDIKEVPLRFLIPFMEKSSLEEENSPLIEKWANLLASASNNPSDINVIFADLLSSISSGEVDILENMVSQELISRVDEIVTTSTTGATEGSAVAVLGISKRNAFNDFARDAIIKIEEEDQDPGEERSKIRNLLAKLADYSSVDYLCDYISYISLTNADPERAGGSFFNNEEASKKAVNYGILMSAGLLGRFDSSLSTRKGILRISLLSLTPLAFSFVRACRGDTIKKPKA